MVCSRCGLRYGGAGKQCLCGQKLVPANDVGATFQLFGATFRGARLVSSPAAIEARSHLRRSLVAALATTGIVFAVLLWRGFAVPSVAGMSGAAVYAVCAIYWGMVGVSDRLPALAESPTANGLFHIAAELNSFGALLLPVFGGALYGFFGGGIYEFLRYRRIAADPASDLRP